MPAISPFPRLNCRSTARRNRERKSGGNFSPSKTTPALMRVPAAAVTLRVPHALISPLSAMERIKASNLSAKARISFSLGFSVLKWKSAIETSTSRSESIRVSMPVSVPLIVTSPPSLYGHGPSTPRAKFIRVVLPLPLPPPQ